MSSFFKKKNPKEFGEVSPYKRNYCICNTHTDVGLYTGYERTHMSVPFVCSIISGLGQKGQHELPVGHMKVLHSDNTFRT